MVTSYTTTVNYLTVDCKQCLKTDSLSVFAVNNSTFCIIAYNHKSPVSWLTTFQYKNSDICNVSSIWQNENSTQFIGKTNSTRRWIPWEFVYSMNCDKFYDCVIPGVPRLTTPRNEWQFHECISYQLSCILLVPHPIRLASCCCLPGQERYLLVTICWLSVTSGWTVIHWRKPLVFWLPLTRWSSCVFRRMSVMLVTLSLHCQCCFVLYSSCLVPWYVLMQLVIVIVV